MMDVALTYTALLDGLHLDSPGLRLSETDVRTEQGPVWLAVDHAGELHLLVGVAEGEQVHTHEGQALRLRENRLPGTSSAPGRTVADLHCTNKALSRVFETMVKLILERLRSDGKAGQAALRHAIDEWRALVVETRQLGREQAQGLFGELYVLGLLAEVEPTAALDWWTGPDGAVHDFMDPAGALEVKTVSRSAAGAKITSLDQLDPTSVPQLALVRVRVEERPEGQTVRELVEEDIRKGCSPLLRNKVVSLLGGAQDADDWTFVVHACDAWIVTDTFPGLRRDDIVAERLERVSRVQYYVDLADVDGGMEATPQLLAALIRGGQDA